MPSSHTEGVAVEVKVGVQQAPRELVIESKQSGEEVAAAVSDALATGGVLTLVDERGRRLVVPVEKLAYVEIGEPEQRRVGFGAL
nr:DUF3107 domain-containing protein [Motilibacter deserti]